MLKSRTATLIMRTHKLSEINKTSTYVYDYLKQRDTLYLAKHAPTFTAWGNYRFTFVTINLWQSVKLKLKIRWNRVLCKQIKHFNIINIGVILKKANICTPLLYMQFCVDYFIHKLYVAYMRVICCDREKHMYYC